MKKIIIFGAGSAIAQATAKLLAKEAAHFVLVDQDAAKLSIIADDLKVRSQTTADIIAANLADTANHPALWDRIKKTLNGLPDITLVAYGTLGDEKANKLDVAIAQKELQTNFVSVVSLLTPLANELAAAKSGTIVAISSVAGDRGRQRNYVYGAAKSGLTAFLSGLRTRLYKQGVTVITIKPGFVDTPMTAHFKKGVLWVGPETIARGIVKAINRKTPVAYLPWFWRYIMLVIRLIPERIFQRLSI